MPCVEEIVELRKYVFQVRNLSGISHIELYENEVKFFTRRDLAMNLKCTFQQCFALLFADYTPASQVINVCCGPGLRH